MDEKNEQVDEGIKDIDLSGLPDDTDWRAKAEELEQRRREDGIRSRERTKSLRDQLAEFKAKSEKLPEPKEDKKPPEFDYSLLEEAYFNSVGLKTEKERALAKDFAKKSGEKLADVHKDEIFQARLQKLRVEEQNADATNIQSNRRGETLGQNSVEYWLAKLSPDEQVPSDLPRELRSKIVEARIKQNTSGKMFYSD